MDRSTPSRATAPRLLARGLKLSHLRLFATLAETGQMSAAAAALAMSQPAASRLAAETEKIAGSTLYQRTSRGVELTAAGQAFARRARRLLAEVDETGRELAEIRQGGAGRVTIGSVTGPAVEYVLPAIRQARIAMPKVEINVEVATSDVLGEALYQGGLDFYIGRLPQGRDKRLFDASPIGPEPISLIVRAGHPLLRTPDRAMNRLAEFDWVLPLENTFLRNAIERDLIARGLPLPLKVMNTSSFMLTVMTISRTNAIAPVSTSVARFFAEEFGRGGAVAELPVGLDLVVEPYALIRMAGSELTPAAHAMLDVVVTEIRRSRLPGSTSPA